MIYIAILNDLNRDLERQIIRFLESMAHRMKYGDT